jgi:hypothetical protein
VLRSRFVVSVIVPGLRDVPPGAKGRIITLDAGHVGIETFDDPVGAVAQKSGAVPAL